MTCGCLNKRSANDWLPLAAGRLYLNPWLRSSESLATRAQTTSGLGRIGSCCFSVARNPETGHLIVWRIEGLSAGRHRWAKPKPKKNRFFDPNFTRLNARNPTDPLGVSPISRHNRCRPAFPIGAPSPWIGTGPWVGRPATVVATALFPTAGTAGPDARTGPDARNRITGP